MLKKNWSYFGNEIRRFREERTLLSQVEFAKKLKISKSLVCKVEAGERRFSNEIISDLLSIFSLSEYEILKFLVISELPFEIKNNECNCYNVIKLVVELKNNSLFSLAKDLIYTSLNVFDDSVDFYVLLSTVHLMENRYKEAEEYIKIALKMYSIGIKSVSTEYEIYHNYGNVFFNMSYDYEFKRMDIISKLVRQNKSKNEILTDIEYIDITSHISKLYSKTEDLFIKSYSINKSDKKIVSQLARLYFNMANLTEDKDLIDKSYTFLNLLLESDDLSGSERVDLSILFSIILVYKGMYNVSIILLNSLVILEPQNILIYFAKSIAYSHLSNDNEMIEKCFYNLSKLLELSNNDKNIKLQILADFNFEILRKKELTKERFLSLIF